MHKSTRDSQQSQKNSVKTKNSQMTDYTLENVADLRIGENHVNQSLIYSNEGYSIM